MEVNAPVIPKGELPSKAAAMKISCGQRMQAGHALLKNENAFRNRPQYSSSQPSAMLLLCCW